MSRWDEAKHPRLPEGKHGGGQFTSGSGQFSGGKGGQFKGGEGGQFSGYQSNMPVKVRAAHIEAARSEVAFLLRTGRREGLVSDVNTEESNASLREAVRRALEERAGETTGWLTRESLAEKPRQANLPHRRFQVRIINPKGTRADAERMTHEKLGHTNQGLWHHQGMQLPAYIQHIAKDLHEERGMPLSVAIATAISQVKKWAAGGEDVKPDTRAKAVAALAEWERLKVSAHAKSATRGSAMSDYDSDGFDSSWDDLSGIDSLVGFTVEDAEAADGGDSVSRSDLERLAKLGSGGRFKALVKSGVSPALAAWIGRKKYGKAKMQALAAKKRKGTATRGELFRCYPLEDIHILTRAEGDGSGRVVEAYATVFGQEAEIRDPQGHYRELVEQTAFDATLRKIERMGGVRRNVKVLYNHGKTMEGVPAPEFQIPLGVPIEVRPETRGLLTRTEYDAGDPFTDRILGKIHSGAISAYSFVGSIMRSDPELRGPGDRYGRRGGPLPLVKRIMLGLREYGPVLFPAYTGAEILGVRMSIPGSDDEPDFDLDEEFAAEDEAPDAGRDPGESLPSRSDTGHRIYAARAAELRPDREGSVPEWRL